MGDRIKTLVPTTGEMPEGGEITYPAGTLGRICSIDAFGPDQGIGVTVSIGDWEGDGKFRIIPDDPDVCEIGDVELIHRINSGNVCHAPCQEISVTEVEC